MTVKANVSTTWRLRKSALSGLTGANAGRSGDGSPYSVPMEHHRASNGVEPDTITVIAIDTSTNKAVTVARRSDGDEYTPTLHRLPVPAGLIRHVSPSTSRRSIFLTASTDIAMRIGYNVHRGGSKAGTSVAFYSTPD